MAEQSLCKRKVGGSTPLGGSQRYKSIYVPIAQWIEQGPSKAKMEVRLFLGTGRVAELADAQP